MKKYKIKLWIIIIISLCIILINSGFLTMQYYPARVAKQGKMLVGVGFHEENIEGLGTSYIDNLMLWSGVFVRYVLPYNFDIGLNMRIITVIPYLLTINVRKQFDFNNNLIHAITFDVEYGWGLGDTEFYTSISMIRNNFAFTVGYEYLKGEMLVVNESSNRYKEALLIKASNEYKYKDFSFNIMPNLYYRISKEYDDNTPNILIHEIGIGVSFYFDLL